MRASQVAVVAAVVTLVLAAIAGGVILITHPFDRSSTVQAHQSADGGTSSSSDQGSTPATSAAPPATTGSTAPITTTTATPVTTLPPPTAPPTAPPTVPPTTSFNPDFLAEQQLRSLDVADRPEVQALLGSWVPQLSSKRAGTHDPRTGITYDLPGVLAYHQGLIGRLNGQPPVLLLNSRGYNFRYDAGGGYWVSIADIGFDTKQAAEAWCDDNGFPAERNGTRDACLGKQLSLS